MKSKFNIVAYINLIIFALVTIFPVFYIIMGSFKTNMEIMNNPGALFPEHFTFDNYIEACNSPDFKIGKMLTNSIVYTLWNVFFTVMVSAAAGYVFARGHFKGKNVIFVCISSLLFIKLGGIQIYPTFEVLNSINLTSSLFALMIVNVFSIPVVYIFLVRGYIDTIPKAIDDAAKIDGCSFTGILLRVIMPLLKPILATVAILTFQSAWNDYLMPTVFTVTNPEQRTLIVGLMALKNSGGAAASWNLMLAGSTIALIPMLIAYIVGNKYFVSGLSAGAVKG